MTEFLGSQFIAWPADARQWYLLALLTVLGGVVGSFVNVVVYRLPAGMSLLWPGSRCPQCDARIRWLDNLPVLGWLKLRGRCRDCGQKISIRYPAIELLTALVFMVLALVEPLNGGRNLPGRLGVAGGEVEYLLGFSEWQLWAVYAYHLLLVCALLCAMLLEHDGFGISRRLLWPVLIVGMAAPLACLQFRPVPAFQVLVEQLGPQPVALAAIDGLAGLAVGVVMGMLASPLAQLGPAGRQGVRVLLFASTSVGLFLGWQAAAILMVLASVLYAMITVYRSLVPALRRLPLTGLLWIGTLAWIAGWRRIVVVDERLASDASGWLLASAGGIVLLAALIGWAVDRRRAHRAASPQQPTTTPQ